MNRSPISLPELVPGYIATGFPKAKAVHVIIELHLGSRNARGKGNKAAKRAALLGENTEAELRALHARMTQRIRDQRKHWWAAYHAEHHGEGREVAHHYATNIHE